MTNNNKNINKHNPNSLLNEEIISNNIRNQHESQSMNNVQLMTKRNLVNNTENDIQTDDLKEKWELILSKLELPSTKMLLSQQAELASIDANEVLIALSPNWENMIKSRKIIIENAIKEIFGDHVKLNFFSKKIDVPNSDKSKVKVINHQNETDTRQSKDLLNSNSRPETPKKGTDDNSSLNLANFFNGEIVDLEE